MADPALIIIVTGILVAASCALAGTFLVLRKMSMMSDAISHAMLPGLVVAIFIVGERATVPVVIGGVLTGVLTVTLTEILFRTKRLKEDSAIGVVFPVLFAIGVILITQAGNVHIDTHHVLYGAIEYSPFETLEAFATNIGPKSIWVLGILAVANLAFIILLYKELKVSTFDAALAATLGFAPALVHYLLMVMVATTAVVSFESVGAILVIAFFIVPPAAAYLLTDRLAVMMGLSVLIGGASAAAGYLIAIALDVSVSGAMAMTTGAVFAGVWMAAPKRGLLSQLKRRLDEKNEVAADLLLVHLVENKDGRPSDYEQPRSIEAVRETLGWSREFAERTAAYAKRNGLVVEEAAVLTVVPDSRSDGDDDGGGGNGVETSSKEEIAKVTTETMLKLSEKGRARLAIRELMPPS